MDMAEFFSAQKMREFEGSTAYSGRNFAATGGLPSRQRLCSLEGPAGNQKNIHVSGGSKTTSPQLTVPSALWRGCNG